MTAAMCQVLDGWSLNGDPLLDGSGKKGILKGGVLGGGAGAALTTKRLHQIMEDRLQKESVGSQPIFKQLLPHDPEQYITLPNLRVEREREDTGRGAVVNVGGRRGRGRGYFVG